MANKYDQMAIGFANSHKKITTQVSDVVVRQFILTGWEFAVASYCKVAAEQNPRFDDDYFMHYINEILDGLRDEVTGKKLKRLTHSQLSQALIEQRKARQSA